MAGLARAITPGPGHLILVQAAPGAGKSTIALWWILHMDKPGLYLSLDSDLATQAARATSMLTSIQYEEVVRNVPEWQRFLKQEDRKLPMMIDESVTADDVDGLVEAFEEFYADKPSLVVVDNLKDLVSSYTFENVTDTVRKLIRVARKRKIVILLLHHVNRHGGAGKGNRPPSLDDGKFGGEDDAPFVLGLWQAWDEFSGPVLKVRINKNRFGPKDFDVSLRLDWERMQVTDA